MNGNALLPILDLYTVATVSHGALVKSYTMEDITR